MRNDHGLVMQLEEILLRYQQKHYNDSRLILVEPGPHRDEYEISNAGEEVAKLVRELQSKAWANGFEAGAEAADHLQGYSSAVNPYDE